MKTFKKLGLDQRLRRLSKHFKIVTPKVLELTIKEKYGVNFQTSKQEGTEWRVPVNLKNDWNIEGSENWG